MKILRCSQDVSSFLVHALAEFSSVPAMPSASIPPGRSAPVTPTEPASSAPVPPAAVTVAASVTETAASSFATVKVRLVMTATGSAPCTGPSAVEDTPQLPGDGLEVHEVAEAGAGAFPHLILAAAGLSEVSDRRQLCVDGSATKPPVVQLLNSTLCVLLAAKFDVDITNQMVSQIVADIHLLNFTVLLFGFNETVFKKVVIMLLHFVIANVGQVGPIGRLG